MGANRYGVGDLVPAFKAVGAERVKLMDIMIDQTRLLLDAASTMKAPRQAGLKGLLLLLCGRSKSRGFWCLPHGVGELAMVCLVLFIGTLCFSAKAAKLDEVRTVDDEIVMVRWLDGEVEWKDTGTGPNAFRGLEDSAGEVIHKFAPPLDTAAAVNVDNYSIASTSDTQYATPTKPLAAYRKTKVSGTDRGWPNCNCTLEHTIFLKLPKKLRARRQVHAEHRPVRQQRQGLAGVHVRRLLQRLRGHPREPHRLQPGSSPR